MGQENSALPQLWALRAQLRFGQGAGDAKSQTEPTLSWLWPETTQGAAE